MSTKKYVDWRGWWDGMRSKAVQAGAESVATNLGMLITTNAADNMHVPGMVGSGESLKTAAIGLVFQFCVRAIWAAAKYVAAKPDPDVITETTDTVIYSQAPDGTSMQQTSSTIRIMPISPNVSEDKPKDSKT